MQKILEEKQGVCGFVLDKVDIRGVLEGLIAKGFNVRVPTEKLKPVATPVGNEPTMTIRGKPITLDLDRARGMGVLGAAFGMGFVAGPALGGLLSTVSIATPGFAAAALAALNGAAAFLMLPEPLQRSDAGGRTGAARLPALVEELSRKGVRRLLAIYLVTSLSFSAMESTFAFLAEKRYGLDVAHVSWVFAYIGVIVAVVQGGLVGPLSRGMGEVLLLWMGLSLQAVALLFLPGASGLGGLLAASAPLAVGSGLASPAMSALLSRQARAENQGGTLGLGQSAAALGRIVGPAAGTVTFAQVSMVFPYLAGAGGVAERSCSFFRLIVLAVGFSSPLAWALRMLVPFSSVEPMKASKARQKCLHCKEPFLPDYQSGQRQRYCLKPECRRARKQQLMRAWLAKPENRDYFRDAKNAERVRDWQKAHPGY